MKRTFLLFSLCLLMQFAHAQWESYDPGFSEVLTIWDMDAVDENTVWALGVAGTYSGLAWEINPARTFTTTSDGGLTWTTGELPLNDDPWAGFQISAVSGTTAWAAVSNFWGGAAILKTSDGGQTWTDQNVYGFPGSFASVIHFWDENNGITIGDPADGFYEIYTTGDGGENWVRTPIDQIPQPLPNEYSSTSTYAVYGDHIWFGTSTGRVYRSADRGQNWEVAGTPIGSQSNYNWVEGIAFQDSLVGICHSAEYTAVPFVHTIAYTEDGGETWTKQVVEDPLNSLFKAQFIPGTSVLVKTSRASNGNGPFLTSYSFDYGVHWMDIDVGTPLMDFEFLDNATGWGGRFKTNDDPTQMYKFTGDPISAIFDIPTLDAEINIHPNPTQSYALVEINLEESAAVNWTLTDFSGRILEERQLDKSDYFTEIINLNNYAEGVYSLLIQTKNGIISKKIVKQ